MGYMMHYGGKAKGKGKGKQGFVSRSVQPLRRMGSQGRAMSETPDVLDVWRIGTSVSRMS